MGKIDVITQSRFAATEKWREYVSAEKIYRKPEFRDLKKVYAQLKDGKKVIDIFKVIQKGGVHSNHHPKMAIAKVGIANIYCTLYPSGKVKFVNRQSRWSTDAPDSEKKEDVCLPEGCLPVFDRKIIPLQNGWLPDRFELKAPVPIVPPEHLPKKLTNDYYILWEVDEWKQLPPTDPWLLRRITKNMFVVLAGWDLTEIEKSVMHGKMY